jgi:hypothetical protein
MLRARILGSCVVNLGWGVTDGPSRMNFVVDIKNCSEKQCMTQSKCRT